MESKHTPAPWLVSPPTRENPSSAMVIANSGFTSIYDAPLTSETEANANLIAAAPDLLAACEDLLEGVPYGPAYVPAVLLAEAAIKKAKGMSREINERLDQDNESILHISNAIDSLNSKISRLEAAYAELKARLEAAEKRIMDIIGDHK